MANGIVLKSTGSWYLVRLTEGEVVECRIVGKFRLGEMDVTNPVAVGDMVTAVKASDGAWTITEIEPRRNYVVRQSPHNPHQVHLMASNIDQAVLVSTIVQPNLKPGFIDRFLVMTEPYDIPVIIVFNKWDLYKQKDREMYDFLDAVYSALEYTVMHSSVVSGEGIAALQARLEGKTTLFSGQSGVGKSSLLNACLPGLELRVAHLSTHSGKGQHTTTFAEMFDLPGGGSVIDTPGIKSLSFNHLEIMDVAHNFRELFAYSKQCKFSNCTHRNEPACAVKKALEEESISAWRYQNYLAIIDEIEQQNYWERKKNV